jgi:nitroreductase
MVTEHPVIEAILGRRSTRGFLADIPVERTDIETIIHCGMAAPSSKNAQPWRFHIVDRADGLDRLASMVEQADDIDEYVPHDPLTGRPRPEWQSTVLESAAALRSAAVAVFIENRGVFSKGRRTLAEIPRPALAASLTGYGLEVMGIGTAIENMLLAAGALGLGAAFIGDVLVAEGALSKALGAPGDLMGVVLLGYSNYTPAPRARRPVDDSTVVSWHR